MRRRLASALAQGLESSAPSCFSGQLLKAHVSFSSAPWRLWSKTSEPFVFRCEWRPHEVLPPKEVEGDLGTKSLTSLRCGPCANGLRQVGGVEAILSESPLEIPDRSKAFCMDWVTVDSVKEHWDTCLKPPNCYQTRKKLGLR